VTTTAPATAASLDGFEFGYLPAGATSSGLDSHYTATVGPDGLRNPGPPPAPGEPGAAVSMRRFTEAGESGSWFFVSVLRPFAGQRADPSQEQMTRWLTQGLVSRADRAEPFEVDAGRAYLLEHRGTEVTSHSLVITAPSGAVLTVEGAASLTAAELRRIATAVVPG